MLDESQFNCHFPFTLSAKSVISERWVPFQAPVGVRHWQEHGRPALSPSPSLLFVGTLLFVVFARISARSTRIPIRALSVARRLRASPRWVSFQEEYQAAASQVRSANPAIVSRSARGLTLPCAVPRPPSSTPAIRNPQELLHHRG